MKLHRMIATVLATAALSVSAFAAEDETPLGTQMEKVSKALKAVGRAAKEGKVSKDLAAKVEEAQKATEEALKFEPAKAKEVPAGEKEKFLADYKASMQETIKTLDELKAAVEAEKADEVGKIMEKLNGQKKEGHKAFKKED